MKKKSCGFAVRIYQRLTSQWLSIFAGDMQILSAIDSYAAVNLLIVTVWFPWPSGSHH